jgi:hypothetical protein
MRLQTHFELRAEHPRLALFGLDHKRLAGVRNREKPGTTTQLNMPLATAEIHGNRTVGIQRYLRLISQGHGANFTRR